MTEEADADVARLIAADAEAGRQTGTARRRWLAPTWRAEALAWVADQLGQNGLRITGPIEQPRIRPWATGMIVPTNAGTMWFGEPDEERRVLTRLRDAYLEPWTVEHARADLAATVTTAMRVAIVGRALSWPRGLRGVPPHDRGEWTGNIGGWLLDLFEPAPQ